jgi:hypothetical protein
MHTRMHTSITTIALALLTATSAAAQNKEPESKQEETARLARKSAGVIIGT